LGILSVFAILLSAKTNGDGGGVHFGMAAAFYDPVSLWDHRRCRPRAGCGRHWLSGCLSVMHTALKEGNSSRQPSAA
jgi:hypothetical protein